MREFATPLVDVAGMIADAGGATLNECFQCGTCSGTCPWNLVQDFRARQLIGLAQLGLSGYEGDDLWLCATCGACAKRCPRGVEIPDLIATIRRIMTDTGTSPPTLKGLLAGARSNGNPWGGDAELRSTWASTMGAPVFAEPAVQAAYFPCCTHAYDPRNKKVARAVLKMLDASGIRYGILGGERCCGDAMRKAGGGEVAEELAGANLDLLEQKGVRQIIVASPHCLESFKKEYGERARRYQVVHVSEALEARRKAGAFALTRPLARKAIYHDPCYLGRYNGVYDAPRALLGAIPGLTLLEFDRHHEDSLCCGGGGGRLWLETPVAERFSVLRLQEAIEKGADTLVTSCPYCVLMFEDAKLAIGREDIAVADVCELLAESLEGEVGHA